jgi:hypothetical protein
MLTSPVYTYGINLLPTERVAGEVMKLNVQLALAMQVTGVTYSLNDIDQCFQALLRQLENYGICKRGESLLPIFTKD